MQNICDNSYLAAKDVRNLICQTRNKYEAISSTNSLIIDLFNIWYVVFYFPSLLYDVGSSFWSREEEDEAERWSVLYADLSHCGSTEEITSYWPKYLCSWRPRSNCTGQKPIQHGRYSRGISKRRIILLMKFFILLPHSFSQYGTNTMQSLFSYNKSTLSGKCLIMFHDKQGYIENILEFTKCCLTLLFSLPIS